MAQQETKKTMNTRYAEDGFDLDRAKRNLNNVALANRRNKKLRFLLGVGKFFIMIGAFGLFLLLFYLAMELIALF